VCPLGVRIRRSRTPVASVFNGRTTVLCPLGTQERNTTGAKRHNSLGARNQLCPGVGSESETLARAWFTRHGTAQHSRLTGSPHCLAYLSVYCTAVRVAAFARGIYQNAQPRGPSAPAPAAHRDCEHVLLGWAVQLGRVDRLMAHMRFRRRTTRHDPPLTAAHRNTSTNDNVAAGRPDARTVSTQNRRFLSSSN
jgi:hypothetical protein